MEQDDGGYDCGTLSFMAGGYDDEEFEPLTKKKSETVKQLKKVVQSAEVARDDEEDPMDCSALVAMAAMNSFVEEDTRPTAAVGKSPKSSPVKTVVDRATSPTLPAHLVLSPEIVNTNANNSNAEETKVVEDEAMKKKEEEKEARARLHVQYRRILQDKRLKRTGSLGSNDSRLSLSTSLSLIPESVPASRGVGDKLSNEFPLANATAVGGGGAPVNEEPVKRVSFQDQSRSPSPLPTSDLRPIGRPLPARLLPPIGTDTSVYGGMDSLVSPRSGSRPLPPLAGMGTGHSKSYDTLSLQSAGSSTQILHKSGSTNSLPTPDPRYSTSNVRGGHMQKMGGARRKTTPPNTATPYGLKPLPSIGISNVSEGLSPRQLR